MSKVVRPVQTILEKTFSLLVNHIKSQSNGTQEVLFKHTRYHPFFMKGKYMSPDNTFCTVFFFSCYFYFSLYRGNITFISYTVHSFPFNYTTLCIEILSIHNCSLNGHVVQNANLPFTTRFHKVQIQIFNHFSPFGH